MNHSSDNEEAACKILVVEDHPVFSQALRQLLEREPGLAVCGAADNVEKAWSLCQTEHPALVMVDLSLKRSHGLELVQRLKEECPGIRILVMTIFPSREHEEEALASGADGFVKKGEGANALLAAVRRCVDA